MHEELDNFERNQVWELIKPSQNYKPIGTKCVWKNKEGESGGGCEKQGEVGSSGV
jgi:hypothetical protein